MSNENYQKRSPRRRDAAGADDRQRGTATLIAVLLLALLSVFVALALSRVTTEAIILNNDSLNMRSYYAAQASLELMTRNFGKMFNSTISPTAVDIHNKVELVTPANFGGTLDMGTGTPVPYDNFAGYTFKQEVFSAGPAESDQPIGGGEFAGLSAERAPYKMVATATHTATGASVTLTRNFISNVIPIFQFGIFYDHELEFYSGTNFNFGGLVHSNDDIYLLGGTDSPVRETMFSNKVSAVGHIVHDVTRNGLDWTKFGGLQDNIKIYNNASPMATPVPFDHASGLKGTVTGGPDTTGAGTEEPTGTLVANWDSTYAGYFGGNLKRLTKPLKLPISGGGSKENIELIKRGSPAADYEKARLGRVADEQRPALAGARFFNKPGIRISLADSRSKLPGCYDGTQADLGRAVDLADPRPCGIRLDGAGNGYGGDSGSRTDASDGSRGYEPLQMIGGSAYKAKRVNGYRLYTGQSYPAGPNGVPALPPVPPPAGTVEWAKDNRQSWIKVEIVPNSGAAPADVTEEFLSLGLTHRDPTKFDIGDSRAIIKIQRYEIPGTPVTNLAAPTKLPTAVVRRVDSRMYLRNSAPPGPPSPPPAAPDDGTYVMPPPQVPSGAAYGVIWSGQVQAPASADYRFRTHAKDGVRLWVKTTPINPETDAPIIDNWPHPASNPAGTTTTAASDIALTGGQLYHIRFEHYERAGMTAPISAQVTWQRMTGTPGPEEVVDGAFLMTPEGIVGGLRADYVTDSDANIYTLASKQVALYDSVRNVNFVAANDAYTTVITNTNQINAATLGLTAKTEAEAQVSRNPGGDGIYGNGDDFDDTVIVGGTSYKPIPVPIEMFDSREGVFNTDLTELTLNSIYTNAGKLSVPWNGVMGMVDLDMANVSALLRGDFNGKFPTGTTYSKTFGAFAVSDTTIPNIRGRLIYISDRRGDWNFDGQFGMEDIYGPLATANDGVLQPGEDTNGDNTLAADFEWEGSMYRPDVSLDWKTAVEPLQEGKSAATYKDLAAVFDHRYYRRGVRLINGQSLYGTHQQGITVASENGVYVQGNYNATGISSLAEPTPSRDFCPNSDPNLPDGSPAPTNCTDRIGQVPAGIVGDAITILSNNWRDGNSFASPFTVGDGADERRMATTTTVRAAMIAGDTISSLYFDVGGSPLDASAPSQGGGVFRRLNGGVHNYVRMLEWWKTGGLNYAGSMINLYHSRNNTGSFKFGAPYVTYRAPNRNWTFDASFTNPTRLPPATPVVQHTQTTGFRLVTELE